MNKNNPHSHSSIKLLNEIIEDLQVIFEKNKRKKKAEDKPHPTQYGAPQGSKRDKALDRCKKLYKDGKTKEAAKCRDNMEKKEREKKSFKNTPRPDTKKNESKLDQDTLRELLEEILEFEKLEYALGEVENLEQDGLELIDEKKKRKKKKKKKASKGLSAAVKKSLDKKADKRCLTRGSVYSEFRKGLAAYLSSGSRKGMTAHQWAHARVNSATPSKPWATVKKRKTCPKKK